MHLYDDVTVVATKPAPPAAGPVSGYCTDGSPGVTARTTIRAWIINSLISELVNVVTAAGLTPSRTDDTQVLAAIRIISAVSAATTSTAGIVQLATPTEVTTGTNTAKATTPQGVAGAIASAIAPLATSASVTSQITALIGGAPGALDTLKELADAINDDASFAATITSALGLKAPLASPSLTGTPTAPTPAGGDNSTKIATTAFIVALLNGKISVSLGNPGWIKIAGLMIQWGVDTTAVTLEGSRTLTFPVAFNSACYGVFTSVRNTSSNTAGPTTMQEISLSSTGGTFFAQSGSSSIADEAGGYRWVALGDAP